jgi:predicted anti-sigma-YlaC factor YlaD
MDSPPRRTPASIRPDQGEENGGMSNDAVTEELVAQMRATHFAVMTVATLARMLWREGQLPDAGRDRLLSMAANALRNARPQDRNVYRLFDMILSGALDED